MPRVFVLLALAAACGGTPTAPPAPVAVAISAIAPPAGSADLEVARVGGRPVWASCVVEQAQRHHLDRAQALDQCIAFELMAQEAEKRRLDTSPEVAEATRTALVSRVIATAYEDAHKTPADFGEYMTKILDKEAWRQHRPELRASTYIRLSVAKDATPEVDAQAKVTAQKIADALAHERGLSSSNFIELGQRAVPGVTFDHSDVAMRPAASLEGAYAAALFAVPEVGTIAGPVRTRWGWDVILWADGLPAKETTRDELAAELLPEVRRAYFTVWLGQLIKERDLRIEVHPEQLELDEQGATR